MELFSKAKLTLDQRRNRIDRWAKFGLFAVVAFFVAPIVLQVIGGLTGLITAAVIGLAGINLIPVISMKFANWRIKAIKYESMINPIETLQNTYKDRQKKLQETRENIIKFDAVVRGYRADCVKFAQRSPSKATIFNDTAEKMERLLEQRKKAYDKAVIAQEHMASSIEEAEAVWDMVKKSDAITEAARISDDDFFEKLKTETSFGAVQDAANRTFAELDMLMREEIKEPLRLENEPNPYLGFQGQTLEDLRETLSQKTK